MTHQHANYKENRLLRRNYETSLVNGRKMPWKALSLACLVIILLIGGCNVCHAGITDRYAINACIGEAEGETYLGKVMLLYTLKNRGSIKGVYGVNAPRVKAHQYAQVTYNQCAKAWAFAKSHPNPSWLATGWGNEADIRIFRKYSWWKNCVVIAHVGHHFFYMERKA